MRPVSLTALALAGFALPTFATGLPIAGVIAMAVPPSSGSDQPAAVNADKIALDGEILAELERWDEWMSEDGIAPALPGILAELESNAREVGYASKSDLHIASGSGAVQGIVKGIDADVLAMLTDWDAWMAQDGVEPALPGIPDDLERVDAQDLKMGESNVAVEVNVDLAAECQGEGAVTHGSAGVRAGNGAVADAAGKVVQWVQSWLGSTAVSS